LKVVFDAYAQGISLFATLETKNQKMNT